MGFKSLINRLSFVVKWNESLWKRAIFNICRQLIFSYITPPSHLSICGINNEIWIIRLSYEIEQCFLLHVMYMLQLACFKNVDISTGLKKTHTHRKRICSRLLLKKIWGNWKYIEWVKCVFCLSWYYFGILHIKITHSKKLCLTLDCLINLLS